MLAKWEPTPTTKERQNQSANATRRLNCVLESHSRTLPTPWWALPLSDCGKMYVRLRENERHKPNKNIQIRGIIMMWSTGAQANQAS